MHAGIPATIEQCDVLHPGTPEYAEEMQQRRKVDRVALAALNGNVELSAEGSRMYYETLPLPYKDYGVPKSSILSCSTYTRGGERIIRFGIATGPNTMVYIDYDEQAAMDFVKADPGGDAAWDRLYSFETLFAEIASGKNEWVTFGVFFDQSGAPFDRPGEFGFEGVYEFFDTPLPGPFVIRLSSNNREVTITNFADLAFVSHDLSRYDPESQQRILEELEKYIWPGSIMCILK